MSKDSVVTLKLVLSLSLIIAVGVLPAERAGLAWLAVPVLLVGAARAKVGLGVFLRRTAKALPFLLVLTSLSLVQDPSGSRFASLIGKSLVSCCTLQLLIATTPTPALLGALRRLRVPEVLSSTVALLARYLVLLSNESERMRRARRGRTLHGSRWALWRSLAGSLGLLFVRSVQRAERVQAAMRARGGA